MSKNKNIVTINWEEEEGSRFIRNPGEYTVKATAAELNEDEEDRQYIKWTFQVIEGKDKGATITTSTYITPKALWKLRELLECLGMPVGTSAQKLNLDKAIEEGNPFVIEVSEGKERADGNGYYMQVSDYMPLEDYKETKSTEADNDEEEDEEDEPEEKPAKKTKPSKKAIPEKSEDDILDEMEEQIDELGLDLDLDEYDTFEEKVKAFEKAKAKASKEDEEADDEDEEEEVQTYTVEEIEALGTKQLKAIAKEIGLELDEESSTRSRRRSVIAGLRKVNRLEE